MLRPMSQWKASADSLVPEVAGEAEARSVSVGSTQGC